MLKIRLTRLGDKKTPFYRVVVTDSRKARDGEYIDLLGTFNPLTNPETVNIDAEKATKWLSYGAQPTDTVRALLKKAGLLAEKKAKKEEKPAKKTTKTAAKATESAEKPAKTTKSAPKKSTKTAKTEE